MKKLLSFGAGIGLVVASALALVPVSGTQTAYAATISECSTTETVRTTDLKDWDFSQTRSTGHYELTDDGLRIWTEGATGTDKVAGYYDTDFPLSGLGTESIADSLEYEAKDGGEPGLQLVIDFDNDGSPDGILVGETIYGENWWLNKESKPFVQAAAPNTGGGSGSQWYGTADEWYTAFPDAVVENIGFSLGSGVLGDGIIKSINLGCVEYTFAKPPATPKSKDECKNEGWRDFSAGYKNQGDCVSSLESNKKSSNPVTNFFRSIFSR